MLLPTITEWAKRHTAFTYTVLTALGLLGAWLVGFFEGESKPPQEITLLDLALSFFGLFIFCAALVAIVVLIAGRRKPMTVAQAVAWERIRTKGKWAYVRNFSIPASFIIVLPMFILVLTDRSHGGLLSNLKIYGVVTAGIIGYCLRGNSLLGLL